MPRVPVLQPQQRLSPLPSPNLTSNMTPDMMGAAQGKMLQKLGNEALQGGVIMNRMEADEQMRVNHVRVNDAMNKAVAAQLDLTHNKETGYANIRGEKALSRPEGVPLDDEYTGKLKERLAGISSTLGNDYQKQQFQLQADQMLVGFRGSLQQHVSRAFTEHSLSVADGTVQLARQKMALEYGNPESVARAAVAIRQGTYDAEKLKGTSEKEIPAAIIRQISPGHLSVIAAAADNGNLTYAKEYFKQVKAELTPGDLAAAKNTVDTGDFEARTQEGAEKMMGDAKGNVQLAIKTARAKYSGKEEDGIVTRLLSMNQQTEMFREQNQRRAAEAAWGLHASGKTVPPSVLAAMDGQARYSLQQAQKAEAQGGVKTDFETYSALAIEMAQDPDAFAKRNLLQHAHQLSPSDLKAFIDKQQKVDKPDNLEVVAFQSQVTTMTQLMGLKGEKAGLFNKMADAALHEEQTNRNRKLTQVERQAVLDRLAQDVVVEGTFFNGTAPYYEELAKGKTPGEFKFSSDQEEAATNYLTRVNKRPPSHHEVRELLMERLLLTDKK